MGCHQSWRAPRPVGKGIMLRAGKNAAQGEKVVARVERNRKSENAACKGDMGNRGQKWSIRKGLGRRTAKWKSVVTKT